MDDNSSLDGFYGIYPYSYSWWLAVSTWVSSPKLQTDIALTYPSCKWGYSILQHTYDSCGDTPSIPADHIYSGWITLIHLSENSSNKGFPSHSPFQYQRGHYHWYSWLYESGFFHAEKGLAFSNPTNFDLTAVTIYHLPDTINVLVQRWVEVQKEHWDSSYWEWIFGKKPWYTPSW